MQQPAKKRAGGNCSWVLGFGAGDYRALGFRKMFQM